MNPFLAYLFGILLGAVACVFYLQFAKPCVEKKDSVLNTLSSPNNLKTWGFLTLCLWGAMVFALIVSGNIHSDVLLKQILGFLIYASFLFATMATYTIISQHSNVPVQLCATDTDFGDKMKVAGWTSGVLGVVGLVVLMLWNHTYSGRHQAAIDAYRTENPDTDSAVARTYDNYKPFLSNTPLFV